MAKSNNGKVPGTFVSDQEMNELGNLLSTMRDYILSHEARIELIEGWITEQMKATTPEELIESDDAAEAADLARFDNESPNHPA